LTNRVLIGDGGIGTELMRRGLPAGTPPEVWNLERPEVVAALHRDYLQAGAEILTTNSFTASRLNLERCGLGDQVIAINEAAARLAADAAGGSAWVIGSIGPGGDSYELQARALLSGGADAIMLETFSSAELMRHAIEGAQAAGAEVVLASMTFKTDGSEYVTLAGVSVEQAVDVMESAGADALGCNCGIALGMADTVELVGQMRRRSRLPILVQPNAGQPAKEGGRWIYPLTAEEMAGAFTALVEAGARLIGGCCGTGPEYIRLLAAAANSHRRDAENAES
jgi:5-methyltetrahydrofolate--homocysteine methyltransferase